jgi:DNA-binding NtrC family response regulator
MKLPIQKEKEFIIHSAISKSEIIIIDDDPGFSFMLKDYLLTAAEINSELFSNGNEFLEKYKRDDVRTIILDYEFEHGPGGLMILQKIKQLNPLTAVIIVSGQDELTDSILEAKISASS